MSSKEGSYAQTGGIHSNAFNFLSAVSSGVDPRTGMYSSTISLPGVAANNLCGPTVGMGLSFSPLNPVDAGFGVGWSLATTRYDSARRRLSLSSGESFEVDTFDFNGKATFWDRKLRSFDFLQVGVEEFVIVHKSGMTEQLRVIPGSKGAAVLEKVFSPEGYAVTLKQRAANGIVQLDSVIDETGRVLLSAAYETTTVVSLNPGTAQSAAFTFHFGNGWLDRLDLPDGYGDGWLFDYEPTDSGLLLLKGTTVPTGGREEVDYLFEGHALPGAGNQPFSHMPVVLECRRDPGHDQPVMRTRYTYTDRNFFGYGALDDWYDDQDNLYRVVATSVDEPYEYGSTETHYDGIEPVQTVTRTFNRFHLLTLERTEQDGCVKEVATEYDEDPTTSFENQPPTCQLPASVSTRYYLEADPMFAREDLEAYEYDIEGNRLRYRDTNGALEEFEYFPTGGGVGCPEDPLGFVRCLKQKRTSPPPGTEGATKVMRYRYEELQSLDIGGKAHLVCVYEAIHHEVGGRVTETPLSETTQHYFGEGPDLGRLEQTDTIIGDVHTTTDFAYASIASERDARGSTGPALLITETLTGHTGNNDALSVSTRRALSLNSGMSVMDESPDGVVTRYAHDALGRIVEQRLAEATPFKAVETITYSLSHAGSGQEECSVTGVRTRTELDGLGRAIRRVAMNWREGTSEREIWSAQFDAIGRMVSETATDHDAPLATGETGKIALTTSYAYDGWGNIAQSTSGDGVIAHVRVDPIERTEESWSEAAGERSGRSHVAYDKYGQPSRIEHRDANGKATWWQVVTYDGWGHRLSETESAPDMSDRVTRYRYDEYDRVVETELPDKTVVYQKYAGYTDEALVEATGVRYVPEGKADVVDVELGRQAFDGLGRRVLFRSGTRDTRYRYLTPRSAEPDEIVLPSGEVLACTYEKQLGHRPLSIADAKKTIACRFEYHPKLGQLTSAHNELGRQDVEYLPSGQVKSELVKYDADTESLRRIDYYYSLLGSTASYFSSDGEKCQMTYDDFGRLAKVNNGTLETAFTYDAFSRTEQVRTEVLGEDSFMDTSVTYDTDGREIERILVAGSKGVEQTQTMTHSYTAAGKLQGRRWETGTDWREESYQYDSRGRLEAYDCEGTHAPQDPSGKSIASQSFTFDAMDNITTMTTTFADAAVSPRASTFHYASDDPTQLVRIEHVQAGSRESVALEYDANGNLRFDEVQRELVYDTMGRLAGWKDQSGERGYRYDPLDRVGAIDGAAPAPTRFRYYRDGSVAAERIEGKKMSAFHTVNGACVGQSMDDAAGPRTVLLGGDAQGSVVSEAGPTLRAPVYGVYGHRPDDDGASDIAYAGELKERDVGWYLLGNYRAYNPQLMRFHSPDVNSPFGHGGLNAYAYVSGDPVNRVDPTGEGIEDYWAVIAGVGLAIVGAALSFGTLAPAAAALATGAAVTFTQTAAVVSLTTAVLSLGTAAGSIAYRNAGDEKNADVLGWMTLGLGIASAVSGAASAVAGRAAASTGNAIRGESESVGELRAMRRILDGRRRKPPAVRLQSGPTYGWGLGRTAAARPRGPAFFENSSGVLRTNVSANARSILGPKAQPGGVTPNMSRDFSTGIDRTDSGHIIDLLKARARPPSTRNLLNQRDLAKSGYKDAELRDLLEGVQLKTTGYSARLNLEWSRVYFERFVAQGDDRFLHASIRALRHARNGTEVEYIAPAYRPK